MHICIAPAFCAFIRSYWRFRRGRAGCRVMENLAIPTAAAREEAVERAKHGPWAARAGTETE
ncbi:hypothetical protein ACX3T3_06530 [Actinotignum schaalii]